STRVLPLRRVLGDIALYALLLAVSLFMLLPFIWMVSTSLKPVDEIFAIPPIILSPHASFNSYQFLIEHYNILRIVLNTFIVAAGATVLQLFFCSLGGYGFAKYKFPGKAVLFAFL